MTPNELPQVVDLPTLLRDLGASIRSVAKTSSTIAAYPQFRTHRDTPAMLKLVELCTGWADVIDRCVDVATAETDRLSTLTAQGGDAPKSLIDWERDYDDAHLSPYRREDVKRILADWRASLAQPLVAARETYRGERDKPLPSEPFGHYFRAMDGSQHFHTGAQVPCLAQSEITPLYTTPPAPSSSAVEGLVELIEADEEYDAARIAHTEATMHTPRPSQHPTFSRLEVAAQRRAIALRRAAALASTAASGGEKLPDVACADGTLIPGRIVANMERIAAWFKENGSESWHVCGIGPIAEPPGGYVLVRKAVVNFLDGIGPLNGYWFDQTVPGKPYWWRKYLREQPTTAAPAMPEGFVMVPKEPTPEMIEAAEMREDDEPLSDWGKVVRAPHAEIYKAMLAAASAQGDGDE